MQIYMNGKFVAADLKFKICQILKIAEISKISTDTFHAAGSGNSECQEYLITKGNNWESIKAHEATGECLYSEYKTNYKTLLLRSQYWYMVYETQSYYKLRNWSQTV